jgi:hypothetical protein
MKLAFPIILLAAVVLLCKLTGLLPGKKSSEGSFDSSDSISECNSGDEEDREWCRRLKIAKMKEQPSHAAVGEIPEDPKPSRIYDDDPVVFTETQLYVWLSSQTYTLEGYGGDYRNSQKFYFFPTGRFYYKSVMYQGQTTPEGEVGEFWGRYRFTKPDEMEIESDKGEKQTLEVKYGRRNLIFGETTYGQVDWENEALRRQLNQ